MNARACLLALMLAAPVVLVVLAGEPQTPGARSRPGVTAADAVFARNDIQLDVIGGVPDKLREELASNSRATRFHGFVDDIAPFFSAARMAVVPEFIGGGFKLKYLDYIFGRVPVASISTAADV